MPTRRTEPAVVEPVEAVKQETKEPETKYRMDKLRTKCVCSFFISQPAPLMVLCMVAQQPK